jgi:hypothetical protein
MASIVQSGNCNFAYITHLRGSTAEESMKSVFSAVPVYGMSKDVCPPYRPPTQGMFLFAQGSEDPVKTDPYAPKFKQYIETHGLGTVFEHPPVPNPQHANKPGILFVWIVNRDACHQWYLEHVAEPWQEKQGKSNKLTQS